MLLRRKRDERERETINTRIGLEGGEEECESGASEEDREWSKERTGRLDGRGDE